jgi:nitrate/nitrite-specific signal transduction histidine kinase
MARGSDASPTSGEITYDPASLGVRVRDNGRSIDQEILGNGWKSHGGLSAMRERSKDISVELSIWCNRDAGTEIDPKVPAEVAYSHRSKRSPWNRIRHGANGVR